MILHIDTSTKICSVAISLNSTLIDCIDSESDQFIHGEALTVMIELLMTRNNLQLSGLNAISVANGPGSYTGLRIGLSTAKGIAIGLSIPIIALSSLASLIELAVQNHPYEIIAAALDARRNEVFLRIQQQGAVLLMDQPMVVNAQSFATYERMVWIGDANAKIKELLNNPMMEFNDALKASARGQVRLAHERFLANAFDELDTLTPNYTKAFYIGPNA